MTCDRCKTDLFACVSDGMLRCFCETGVSMYQHWTAKGERIKVAEKAARQMPLGVSNLCPECEESRQSATHREHLARARQLEAIPDDELRENVARMMRERVAQ